MNVSELNVRSAQGWTVFYHGEVQLLRDHCSPLKERWQDEHDQAMLVLDARDRVEAVVELANRAFQFLVSADDSARRSALARREAIDSETRAALEALLSEWLVAAESTLEMVATLETLGYAVAGQEAFKEHLNEARWMAADDDELFDRPAFHAARDAALTEQPPIRE